MAIIEKQGYQIMTIQRIRPQFSQHLVAERNMKGNQAAQFLKYPQEQFKQMVIPEAYPDSPYAVIWKLKDSNEIHVVSDDSIASLAGTFSSRLKEMLSIPTLPEVRDLNRYYEGSAALWKGVVDFFSRVIPEESLPKALNKMSFSEQVIAFSQKASYFLYLTKEGMGGHS